MVDRICISINNRCNLKCEYCHFNEKEIKDENKMDVYEILDNVMNYANGTFKIGFVGNGEPFLDFELLKNYIKYISNNKFIKAYTITNGTIVLSDSEIAFLEENDVNVGFSVDGYKELHDLNRCNTFDNVINNVEHYRRITGHYPTFNATVGKESVKNEKEIIQFFRQFGTRVTFSRMIGKHGITLNEYKMFVENVEKYIQVRRGELDCTMYGGRCGAGANNYFFSNGNIYYCGNCVDIKPIGSSSMSFEELENISLEFNRNKCYKESLL